MPIVGPHDAYRGTTSCNDKVALPPDSLAIILVKKATIQTF